MKIAVLGTGQMGRALARAWAACGHRVVLGSRDRERGRRVAGAIGAGVEGSTVRDAAAASEVVVLAVPWLAAAPTIEMIRSELADKPLVDCTNPLVDARKPLVVGRTTSGAEEIQRWAPACRVVKAFNAIAAHVIASGDPTFEGKPAAILYCGDDGCAKDVVGAHITELGYEALDVGELAAARYLEPLAALTLRIDVRDHARRDVVLKPAWRPRRRAGR